MSTVTRPPTGPLSVAIERVAMMADARQTKWDLSENDQHALRDVLREVAALRELAEKATEGWIKAERRLGNTCPICGWDESRPGHIGCQCLKNIKAARKARTPEQRSTGGEP